MKSPPPKKAGTGILNGSLSPPTVRGGAPVSAPRRGRLWGYGQKPLPAAPVAASSPKLGRSISG
jgi:hypothetical protein